MTRSISKRNSKRLALAILLTLTLVITQLAVPMTALAKSANYNTYNNTKISKDSPNVTPWVVYKTSQKYTSTYSWDKGTTYYYNDVSTPLVGQTLTIGFDPAQNYSKASQKVYTNLKKSVSIKKVTWYTKDSKGKITTIGTKKDLKIPASAAGKILFCEYSWSWKGTPGVRSSVTLIGDRYTVPPAKKGIRNTFAYTTVAKAGVLRTTSTYTESGNKYTVKPTSTTTKRPMDKEKAIGKVTYKYQWYSVKYDQKKGADVFTPLTGKAAKTKAYTFPANTVGSYAVMITSSKKNYVSTVTTCNVYVDTTPPPAPPVNPSPDDPDATTP